MIQEEVNLDLSTLEAAGYKRVFKHHKFLLLKMLQYLSSCLDAGIKDFGDIPTESGGLLTTSGLA